MGWLTRSYILSRDVPLAGDSGSVPVEDGMFSSPNAKLSDDDDLQSIIVIIEEVVVEGAI